MLHAHLLPEVERIARAAGELVLAVYRSDFAVRMKADASPVTLADERAEALIVPALQALDRRWPVVAEEAVGRGEGAAAGATFWLVDALDGTREFISRNGEFTINVALVEHGTPVLGVVHVPLQDRLYAGVAGAGAWQVVQGQRVAIACRDWPAGGPVLACSRSHGDEAALAAWLQGQPLAGRVNAGSALKFGLLASGAADVYPRFGRTMEWDTAAGHAVLAAAGGQVLDLAGQTLHYGKPGFENPHFVAYGRGKPSGWPRRGDS